MRKIRRHAGWHIVVGCMCVVLVAISAGLIHRGRQVAIMRQLNHSPVRSRAFVIAGNSGMRSRLDVVVGRFEFDESPPSALEGILGKDMATLWCIDPKVAVLSYREIDDDDVVALSQLQSLEQVELSGTNVTDKGVRALVGLPELRSLDLSFTRITDDVIKALCTMESLEVVAIDGSGVSVAGIDELRRCRPSVTIE